MPQLLHEDAALARIIEAHPPGYLLAADCEFVRERTYWPKLALVQIQIGPETHLLDPLALKDDALMQRLFAGARTTVMHSPSEDLECFLHRYGWTPERIFDTQLAAAFAGLGSGLSYRALVETVTGKVLEKSETRSDWSRRPLSEAQLRYAAEDVLHLEAIHDHLQERLSASGKRAWFDQDCARLLRKAREQFTATEPVLEPRQVSRLDALGARRLQRIFHWRELEARLHDRPRGWILDNETSYKLAAARHGDADAHRRIVAAAQKASGTAREALFSWLADTDTRDLSASPGTAQRNESSQKRLFAQLQDAVADAAREFDLPPGLLLPRRQIEQVMDSGHWPESARGWREDLLAPRLLPLLQAA